MGHAFQPPEKSPSGLTSSHAPLIMRQPTLGSRDILQPKANRCACGGSCPRCREEPPLQKKLTISEPGDAYEREADRVADEVLAKSAHPIVNGAPPRIQRFTAQATGQAEAAPASVDEALASPGSPLETVLRQDMEQRFSCDFSRVRVHSGAAAEQSARGVNAHAYTVGHDIVFGAGQFAPGTHEGRRLIAHELTHVVQQSTGSHHAQHIQRDGQRPAPDDALPEWTDATTSSAEPLPGVPVPGYEHPKAAYTKEDKKALLEALNARENENNKNVGEFLGDYGSALLDLWARYATEAMAAAAAESDWSFFGKALTWLIKESLVVISGAWAGRALGHLGVELIKLMTSAAADVGFVTAEAATASSEVQASRADIDAKTKQLADRLKEINVDVLGQIRGITPYSYWLGAADLLELGRFRIPPAFPHTPTQVVRTAVAQAIVGLLFDSSYQKNAIRMELEVVLDPYLGHISSILFVSSGPFLITSGVLSKELYGRPIEEMPTVPLNITLASKQNPVDIVRSTLSGTELSLQPTLRWEQNIFGGPIPGSLHPIDPLEAFVQAYPSKPPAKIIRKPSVILVNGGGLLEDLYLYQRATKPDEGLESVVQELEEQRLSWDLEGTEPGASSATEQLSPEALAARVWAYLYLPKVAGAEALISETVEPMKLKKPM